MRTRRGLSYPNLNPNTTSIRRRLHCKTTAVDSTPHQRHLSSCRKKSKTSPENFSGAGGGCGGGDRDGFDSLPDDLVLLILCKISSSVACPADFINVLFTCKRLNSLAVRPMVLSKASLGAIAVKAKKWSESAHRFLKLCADSGNVDACYTLGMIRFYCLQDRGGGASLLAKAAINSHAPVLYSLAVIQFNGSGGSRNDKDLHAGVALCARAAFLGHVNALRELGHCLQDGYGVSQNVTEGRRFLVLANARELAGAITSGSGYGGAGCPMLSKIRDFGCNMPVQESQPANRFLAEWFAIRGGPAGPGLRMCSHNGCGRPETRKHEFRRCSVCGTMNYCSRSCQSLDWKLRHKAECAPVERWVEEGREVVGAGHEVGGGRR